MKSNWKKLLSLALVLALVLGFAPGMGPMVSAYDGNPYAALVNTTTAVRFNDMDWYIIADNSTAADAGTVTLLAKEPIAAMPFLENGPTVWNNSSISYKYSTSTLKTYLDGLTGAGGSFADVADAIVPTNLTDLTDEQVSGAKIYPPSSELVNLSSDVLKCTTATGSFENKWWRRTRGNWDTSAGAVDGSAGTNWHDVAVGHSAGVRPALRLDLSKVVFSNNTFALPSPVASVTTSGGTPTEYAAFSDAVNAWNNAANDATLKLLSDVTTGSTISVSGTKTLDLNGYGIKMTGSGSVISVVSGADLTLYDSNPKATHKYTIANSKSKGAGLAVVNDTVDGTTFYGGYITGGTSAAGGGIYTNGGTIHVTRGTIIGNQTTGVDGGGGICVKDGTLSMTNGAVTANHANYATGSAQGGGISLLGTTQFDISGGVISYNWADGSNGCGGGVQGNTSGGITISGGEVFNNYAKQGGGFNVLNTLTATGGVIRGNFADNGGGVCAKQVILSGSATIQDNWKQDSAKSDICLYDKKLITLNSVLDEANSNPIAVGIYEGVACVFTNSTNPAFNDASKFVSDNAGYAVGKNADGQLILGEPVTVTFNANGRGTAPDSLTVPGGSVITSPAAPTETGYTFGGWYTDSGLTSAFDFSAPISADTTLYAKWTINQYTLTFDTDGGSAIEPITRDYNTTLTLPAAPTKADSSFAGWNTKADGSGTPYAPGASLTLTGNLTLYAQWTDKAVHTVSGKVTQGGTAVSGVTLRLVQGEKKIAVTATNAAGEFSFSAPDGIYNIVAVKDGKTKTELVTLNANQQVVITMPSENVNSTLTVTGSGIKNVMVGGLDELAEANSASGQAVTVTMTVEEKENAANKTDIVRPLAGLKGRYAMRSR